MRRKHNLEKLFLRTKSQHESEKTIVEGIWKIDSRIKKLEKEERAYQKLFVADRVLEEYPLDEDEKKESKKPGAYLWS